MNMNKLNNSIGGGKYVSPTLDFYTVSTVSVIATSDDIEGFDDEVDFSDPII